MTCSAFLPTLEKVVGLIREKAQALADGGDAYDALLDDYEPEASGADIAAMFDAMRPRLVALREAVLGAAHQPAALTGNVPANRSDGLGARGGGRFRL